MPIRPDSNRPARVLRAWALPLGACLLAAMAVFALWRRQTRSDEQRYLDWVEGWRASRRQALESRGDSPLAGMRIGWAYYPARPWGRQTVTLMDRPPAGTWGDADTPDTTLQAGRIVTLRGTDGSAIRYELAGYILPSLPGVDTPRALAAYRPISVPGSELPTNDREEGEDPIEPGPGVLLVPFYDATNREHTHPGGRYMDLHPLSGGQWQLDWNLAYAPYCAHRPLICPLPPEGNRLPYAVRAGERRDVPEGR